MDRVKQCGEQNFLGRAIYGRPPAVIHLKWHSCQNLSLMSKVVPFSFSVICVRAAGDVVGSTVHIKLWYELLVSDVRKYGEERHNRDLGGAERGWMLLMCKATGFSFYGLYLCTTVTLELSPSSTRLWLSLRFTLGIKIQQLLRCWISYILEVFRMLQMCLWI